MNPNMPLVDELKPLGAAAAPPANAVARAETVDSSECPLCGSNRNHAVYRRKSFGVVWTLSRCEACGLHQTLPRPNDSQIAAMYAGDYHGELRAPGAAERAFGEKFRRYADWIERYCPRGRALDIGCSTGLLVRTLCDRGYQAEGIELNPISAAWARQHYGVGVQSELLREGLFDDATFQLVVMADVLEHTPSPVGFLRMVRKILKPGGQMFVSFPDILSIESSYWFWLSKMTGRGWLWSNCHIPLHTWEFTRQTAEKMFRAAGFEVAAFRRSQPRPEVESTALKLLALPTHLLRLPGISRLAGSQMEFLIRRLDQIAGQ